MRYHDSLHIGCRPWTLGPNIGSYPAHQYHCNAPICLGELRSLILQLCSLCRKYLLLQYRLAYSRTENQMGSTQDIRIILVQVRGTLHLVWSRSLFVAYSVTVVLDDWLTQDSWYREMKQITYILSYITCPTTMKSQISNILMMQLFHSPIYLSNFMFVIFFPNARTARRQFT